MTCRRHAFDPTKRYARKIPTKILTTQQVHCCELLHVNFQLQCLFWAYGGKVLD